MASSSYRQMVFINLAVESLPDSIKFYKAIGFKQNARFTGESGVMMSLDPREADGTGIINLMLLTKDFFKTFLKDGREMNDPSKTSEVLLALSAGSREAVDELVEAAKKAGGRIDVTQAMDMPNMHGGSFADLDGHVWEVVWMDANASA